MTGSPRPALALLGLLLLTAPAASAQLRLQPDLSFGAGSDGQRTAVALFHQLRPADARWWLALGVRGTAYTGDPVLFASRTEQPGAFEGDVLIEPSVYGINLAGEVGVRLGGRLAVGFNLDLFGVATGSDRATAAGVVSPAALSFFLYGNNDRGSLNSELFAQVRLTRTAHLRLGLSHYVMGYESAGDASFDATRFQRFLDAGFIAIRLGR